MLKVGLLGLGTIGKAHYERGYMAMGENSRTATVEACFDLNEENLKIAEGVRKYTDLDSFFENEKGRLDMVDICLPTFLHKEVAARAMKHDFHVLCEKPMALNYEDASEMCKTAKETGKKLMVAHVLRFVADYEKIYDCIKSNELGKVKYVQQTTYTNGLPQGQNGWFQNTKLSGGSMFDMHVHDVDILNYLIGIPKALSSSGVSSDVNNGFDALSSNYYYQDEKCVNAQSDWKVNNNKHNLGRSLRINFEKGYIMLEKDLFIKVDAEGNVEDLTIPNKTDHILKEISYFAQCIIDNRPVTKSLPEESAMAIKIICSEALSASNFGERIFL